MLAVALLAVLSAAPQPPDPAPAPSAAPKPKVWIDPGHGGRADGASGAGRVREKNLTLAIATKLKAELEGVYQVQVMMSRDRDADVDLWDRPRRANAAKADVFVSVHCNSMPPGPTQWKARGIETYFLSAEATDEQAKRVAALENAEGGKQATSDDPLTAILQDLEQTEAHREASALAYVVNERLVKDLETPDRGVQQAPFIVLMGAQMPAVLVEVGFLSNPVEGKLLSDGAYQERIVKSLAAGIDEFLVEQQQRRAAPAAKPDAGAPAAKPDAGAPAAKPDAGATDAARVP